MAEQTDQAPRSQFWKADRNLMLGLLVVLVLVFALVGSNVAANHAPKPHALPVGTIGPATTVATVANALTRRSPGAYTAHAFSSVAAARTAILHRTVYGAYRPGRYPLLLVATAASPVVASLLQKTFATVTPRTGRPLAVRDLVHPSSSDPNSSTAFSMLLSLILAGELGSVLIFTLGSHRTAAVRLAAVAALGLGAGLVSALVTNVVVAAFPSHFFGVWAVATLFVLAIAVPIASFQSLLGVGGTAVGAIMFLVIGNPASGGGSAPELLPAFWRHISQLLPPGAAITAMRDVVYFHGHGMAQALLVLNIYVALGVAVVLAVQVFHARTATAPDTAASGPA